MLLYKLFYHLRIRGLRLRLNGASLSDRITLRQPAVAAKLATDGIATINVPTLRERWIQKVLILLHELVGAILYLVPRRQTLAKQLAPRHWSCRSIEQIYCSLLSSFDPLIVSY